MTNHYKKWAAAVGLAALSTASFGQVAIDGQILPAEIGTGQGLYTLVGEYTGPRGFGDWGPLALYVGNSNTKLFVGLTGTVERNGNSFQFYLNLPGASGVPSGTALPSGDTTGTSFRNNNAIMDMEVDYATAMRFVDGAPNIFAVSYVGNPTEATSIGFGAIPASGEAATLTAQFGPDLLNGSRAAYFASEGNLNTNPGTRGLEWEFDLNALGLAGQDSIQIFFAMNNQDGGFFSNNTIPQITGITDNLGNNPNFTQQAGLQAATYTIQGVTSLRRTLESTQLRLFPNPASHLVNVAYEVPNASAVTVKVFDVIGAHVATLVDGTVQQGPQILRWNAAQVKAGVYFVQVQVGDGQETRRVHLTR